MITEKDMEMMEAEFDRIMALPQKRSLHAAPKIKRPVPPCHRCMTDEEFMAMDLPW